MGVMNRFKVFDEALFLHHPDLKGFLKPNDQYPELKHVLKNRPSKLPVGSFNSKVIINNGEIVERVYKTPKGKVVSLFKNPLNVFFDQAA